MASVRCMLCIVMTCESGAQARAIWYILKTAVCPVTGSSFSGSFFTAVVVGVSEQAVRIARRAMAGNMYGFDIDNVNWCMPILAMGAGARHAAIINL